MNEYINLTLENIEKEHICCAIGDPKHQNGVNNKKEWIKSKFNEGHIFRKLNARGKVFIEYEVKELTEYSKENNVDINFIKIDSLEKAKNVPCIFNNWANFYKGEFISNTILNANSLKKIISS